MQDHGQVRAGTAIVERVGTELVQPFRPLLESRKVLGPRRDGREGARQLVVLDGR
jgi:hypothetical protein